MNQEIMRRIRQGLLVLLVLGLLYYPFYSGDSSTDSKTMEAAITKQIKAESMNKQDANGLKRFYGISVKETGGFVLYTPKSLMDVDELLIIKLKTGDDGSAFRKAVEARLKTQLKNFSGYGTNQTELLNKHILVIKKGYLFYAVSKQADSWKQIFQDAL